MNTPEACLVMILDKEVQLVIDAIKQELWAENPSPTLDTPSVGSRLPATFHALCAIDPEYAKGTDAWYATRRKAAADLLTPLCGPSDSKTLKEVCIRVDVGETRHRTMNLTYPPGNLEFQAHWIIQRLADIDAENSELGEGQRVTEYDILMVDGEKQHYLSTVNLAKAKDVRVVQGRAGDPLNNLP